MTIRSQITEGQATPEDGIKAVVQDEMQRNNGWLPVRVVVVNFDAGVVRSVDVEPLIRGVVDGEPTVLARALDVPIAQQAANGGASAITMPITAGDYGRIQPAGGDISAWLASGSEQAANGEHGSLDLSDSVFVLGLRPFTSPLPSTAFSTTDTVISGPVQVGDNTASEFVALANLVLSELQSIADTLDTWSSHTHAAGLLLDSGGKPCTGTTAGGPVSEYIPSSVACEKLRSL
jgi:hypothetical protein